MSFQPYVSLGAVARQGVVGHTLATFDADLQVPEAWASISEEMWVSWMAGMCMLSNCRLLTSGVARGGKVREGLPRQAAESG